MRDGLSASDVALLSGNGGNNGNNGFGNGFGDGAWWIIILFLFVFCGWGNNGWGNGGSNGSATQGALTRGDLCMDMNFQELQNAVRNISDTVNVGFANLNSTICNQQYDTARMINQVDTNIMQGNFGLQTAINGVSSQLAGCCCDLREAISGVNYNMAINNNTLQQTLCNNTRDIIEGQVSGTRAILDAITNNRIEDKNAQITAQQNEINALRLSASQQAQNEYLLNQLRNGCPVNAQLVCGNTPIPVQYIGAYGNNCGCGYNNY